MRGIVYWIDDSIRDVYHVVEGVFSQIWNFEDEGYKNQIIIFGNAYLENNLSEKLWTEKDEVKFSKQIHGFFSDQCRNLEIGGVREFSYDERKEFLDGVVTILFKENANNLNFYDEIKKIWMDDCSADLQEDNMSKESNVSQLITLMNIKDDSIVGIDISLLKGDFKKVQEGKGNLICLELFYQLKRKGMRCFLYSNDASDQFNSLVSKIYKDLYGEEDDIENNIVARSDLMKKGNTSIILEILSK